MSSETTMIAEQCRLQEWAAQIRDCQNRPDGMSIVSWCACHGITKANYYYWLRRVKAGFLQSDEKNGSIMQTGLDISIKGVSIHVTDSTSMLLLTEVLKAVRHAQ